jgi:hypothetical protein
MSGAFSSLPIELFLNVLDQLVAARDGRLPVAYAPSDSITKALRALTLVSREIYPVASRYLYAHCLYLGTCTNYSRFRRTLGLHLGNHPQALKYGQAGRNDRLFAEAETLKYITSVFVSPHVTEVNNMPPMVRLPQVIDLFNTIGPTLRRLVMDLQPIYASTSEVESIKPHILTNNIFNTMVNLEELVCSYDTTDYFLYPPPNLKRLASTQEGADDALLRFATLAPSLEALMVLRDGEMDAMDIEDMFKRISPKRTPPLDIVFVGVSTDHVTPEGTRKWSPDDSITFWEIDVPKSYYGDEDDLILCDSWLWEHAMRGTLFIQQKRRMRSCSPVRENLGDGIDNADTTMGAEQA